MYLRISSVSIENDYSTTVTVTVTFLIFTITLTSGDFYQTKYKVYCFYTFSAFSFHYQFKIWKQIFSYQILVKYVNYEISLIAET